MPSFWIQTPSDAALSEMQGWAQLGGNKYAAIRHHLLVVANSDGKGKAKNGPVCLQVEWPINSEFKIEDKTTKVTKYTYNVQESITSTVTTKLSQEILAKVGASAGVSLSKLGTTLNYELQAKLGAELVDTLQSGFATTSTYAVEASSEQLNSLKIGVPAADGSIQTRPLFMYIKLRQLFWDVYLYRTDYLQLDYERNWIWPNVRKTILYQEASLRAPLFRVAYFEPEGAFSFRFDEYEPEVENGESVASLPLSSKCPAANLQPEKTMEQLAKLAFPVSRRERDAAKRQKQAAPAVGRAAASAKRSGASAARAQKSAAKASQKASRPQAMKSTSKSATKATKASSKSTKGRTGFKATKPKRLS